jgi:deoxyribodipyrimidine photolyase-related protein
MRIRSRPHERLGVPARLGSAAIVALGARSGKGPVASPVMGAIRWLFGDQLGPWYREGADRVLLIESRQKLASRRWHRQRLHLVVSAMRHLAKELGDRCTYVRADTYEAGLAQAGEELVTVCEPTSFRAEELVGRLPRVEVVPNPGFATHRDAFAGWVGDRAGKRLLLESFYRWQRARHDVLMDGDEPAGGIWNLDRENREPPPKGAATLGVPPPFVPTEDDVDAEVRADLDRLERDGAIRTSGEDGPRWWAATRREAQQALAVFVDHRLPTFGPQEDAMLAADPVMSHSLLSAPMNLGLLHPLEAVRAAEAAYRDGRAPLNSVEGFVRQILGWREYVWGLYWRFGEGYRRRNDLEAREPLPEWIEDLDVGGEVHARCLSTVLADVRHRGWTHHIPRLMVLGNWMLQRGIDPGAATDWFHRAFVDGADWVMVPNVVGMALHADGGEMATKPYAAGGAYIDRMSDLCGECPYDPRRRTGPRACPFTAGYWWFLGRNEAAFHANRRMRQALAGLARRDDLAEIRVQEDARGAAAP